MPKRKGPKHPGVVLIKPERRSGWRARYEDPDTGKTVKVALPVELTKAEDRTVWAVGKSNELAKRRLELEAGAVRKSGANLTLAVDDYFTAHPHLGKRTVAMYRLASNRLLRWCDAAGIKSADDLGRAQLARFRDDLVAGPKMKPAKNGKRGEHEPSEKHRGPAAINGCLRAIGTVLRFLIDRDVFARLSVDDCRRALKKLDEHLEQPEFLKPVEIRQLLDAVAKYDATCFALTRDEHAGLRERGTTPRYPPVSLLARTLLLTGMRLGEALNLTWAQIDLEAEEIHLRAVGNKTKRARTIDLAVCPSLVATLKSAKDSGTGDRLFTVTANELKQASLRLRRKFKAPETFTWQVLRSTCATYLINAPGIFGAASAYRESRQLGHSVAVAEKHYAGLMKSIPHAAKTLEQAMGIAPMKSVEVRAEMN
jgi:integrase